MNNNQLALLNNATTCDNYLGQTNRGAISLTVRLNTRHCLQMLSAELRTEVARNNNLHTSVNTVNDRIRRRDARILQLERQLQANGITAEKNQDEYLQALRAETAEVERLKEENLKIEAEHTATIAEIIQRHEEAVKDAENEMKKQQEFKRNSNKMLTIVLEICRKNPYSVIGFMNKEAGVDNFDVSLLEDVLVALLHDPDLSFHPDSTAIKLCDAFEHLIITPIRSQLIANAQTAQQIDNGVNNEHHE